MCAVIRICLNRSFVENYLVWGHWIEGMMVTVIGFVGAAHSNLDHRRRSRVVTQSLYKSTLARVRISILAYDEPYLQLRLPGKD